MADHAHNMRADFRVAKKPVGVITRGTTNTNRLRRCDRWMRYAPEVAAALTVNNGEYQPVSNGEYRSISNGEYQPVSNGEYRARTNSRPLAIDVGYGASHTTTVEWRRALVQVAPNIDVLGLEIDPARVLPPREGVRFALGGFELAGHRPNLVRAFNVLRQYDVAQVEDAWNTVCTRLADGGLFVEGTCDELGRRMSWVLLNQDGPQSLTLVWNPWDVTKPSDVAERLPKALIHRNVPGEKIYDLLQAADDAWDRAAPFATFGPRVRWFEARRLLGMPQRRLLRDNWLQVPWDTVS